MSILIGKCFVFAYGLDGKVYAILPSGKSVSVCAEREGYICRGIECRNILFAVMVQLYVGDFLPHTVGRDAFFYKSYYMFFVFVGD